MKRRQLNTFGALMQIAQEQQGYFTTRQAVEAGYADNTHQRCGLAGQNCSRRFRPPRQTHLHERASGIFHSQRPWHDVPSPPLISYVSIVRTDTCWGRRLSKNWRI